MLPTRRLLHVTALESEIMPDRLPDTEQVDNEKSVLDLLGELKAGAINAKELKKADRQLVVEHLITEGWADAAAAKLLQVSTRTIARDRSAIRDRYAVARDPATVRQFVGQLTFAMETAVLRLRRVARSTNARPADQIQAERAIVETIDRVTRRLQSLGVLPTAIHRVEAEVTHRSDDRGGLAELRAEHERIIASFDDPEAAAPEVKELEYLIARLEVAEHLNAFSDHFYSKEHTNDDASNR